MWGPRTEYREHMLLMCVTCTRKVYICRTSDRSTRWNMGNHKRDGRTRRQPFQIPMYISIPNTMTAQKPPPGLPPILHRKIPMPHFQLCATRKVLRSPTESKHTAVPRAKERDCGVGY